MRRFAALATVAAFAAAPAFAQDADLDWPTLPDGADAFETAIIGPQGDPIGTLSLRGGENGVVGRVRIEPGTLEPGWHGAHLHEVGDCSDAPAFEASGGHVGSDGAMHGFLHPEGPEAGDLPSLWAAEDGSVTAEFVTNLVTFEGETPLFDEDGTALVVHADQDDQQTQPIGGSGDRVACAVIARQ